MGALEDIIVSGQNLPFRQTALGFRFVGLIHFPQPFDISQLKGILAELLLALQLDISIGQGIAPADFLEITHPLQGHGDPFQAVGQFHGHRIQIQTTGLLEIGKLGDLQPVQPHFPAQPPGPQHRRTPVILHKADIVHVRIDPQGFQGIQI